MGPRIDRFRDAKSTYISGHSIPLIALGGFILIFGFMAFNGGSQGSISQVSKTVINLQEKVLTSVELEMVFIRLLFQPGDGKVLGSAVLTTFLSSGSGGISTLLLWKVFSGDKMWSLSRTVNGIIAGKKTTLSLQTRIEVSTF